MPAPVVAVAAWTFIVGILPGLIASILRVLGIAAVTYTGLSLGSEALLDFAQNQFQGLPQAPLQLLGILRIDVAIGIIISAQVSALAVRGFTRWQMSRSGVFAASG